MQPYEPPADGRFASILVPTADVVRTSWLLRTAAASARACLLVGDSGAGKTAIVARFLAQLEGRADAALGLNFSSQTSSLHLQRALEVPCPAGTVRYSSFAALLVLAWHMQHSGSTFSAPLAACLCRYFTRACMLCRPPRGRWRSAGRRRMGRRWASACCCGWTT